MFWIGLIIGLVIGGCIGLFVCGLLTVARKADEKMEKWRNGE